jgi:D-beta-D-heptose 7-phosphate kinase/D-beta-D-heptose 1-phosphate adenosyltransferase
MRPTEIDVRLKHLKSVLERMLSIRVAVIGDIMLDRYVYGEVERISPEAPVPVVRIAGEECRLGGAANVARCAQELGAKVDVFGVTGDDKAAGQVRAQLERLKIGVSGVYASQRVKTTQKTRIIAQGQQIVRLDEDPTEPLRPSELTALARGIHPALKSYDAVLFSDYQKGVLTRTLVEGVTARLGKKTKVAANPKPQILAVFANADLVTLNLKEAFEACGEPVHDLSRAKKFGRILCDRLKPQNLVITAGANGMFLVNCNGAFVHIPSAKVDVFDVTGAGDSVLAAAGCALGAGADPLSAAILANLAGGVVVQKPGAAAASAPEILALAEGHPDILSVLE